MLAEAGLGVERVLRACETEEELWEWVWVVLGARVPRVGICANHQGPFEYLRRAYFEPGEDLVVWAPRGGGKTYLGAVATLLDLLHKPGCQVRILGGSLEQSLKMWEHLWPAVMQVGPDLIEGRVRARKLTMQNGSGAAVLTQSQRAVRGLRVQKLRCDEVELFDPGVWEAAQLVTRSRRSKEWGRGTGGEGEGGIAGVVEAISTLHTPFGLMHRVVEEAERAGRPVIRWCLLEVLERCPAGRECVSCPLLGDCQGVAKVRCDGFVRIDDAIAMKQRVSRETWEAEMLCRRPSVRQAVFPNFNEEVHVRENIDERVAATNGQLSLSIDFGFANPFVCLWIRAWDGGVVHVIDEYVQPARQMSEHLEQMELRPWGKAGRVTCDPAGQSRNDQTAASDVVLLRRRGYAVHCRPSRIVDGLEMIRAALAPACGSPRLFVHPRCRRLIRALRSYRYAEGGSELPIKDGEHDHLIDALRYHFVNAHSPGKTLCRRY